jgi:hypothetical protein
MVSRYFRESKFADKVKVEIPVLAVVRCIFEAAKASDEI